MIDFSLTRELLDYTQSQMRLVNRVLTCPPNLLTTSAEPNRETGQRQHGIRADPDSALLNPLFGGTPIIVDEKIGEPRRVQVRFPKTKKWRIRKKWAKRSRNFRTFVDPKFYMMTHPYTMRKTILCNPSGYEKLKKVAK